MEGIEPAAVEEVNLDKILSEIFELEKQEKEKSERLNGLVEAIAEAKRNRECVAQIRADLAKKIADMV